MVGNHKSLLNKIHENRIYLKVNCDFSASPNTRVIRNTQTKSKPQSVQPGQTKKKQQDS